MNWFRPIFRAYRLLLRRDNCEVCNGIRGTRGNENIVNGIVMCDYCHYQAVLTGCTEYVINKVYPKFIGKEVDGNRQPLRDDSAGPGAGW